VAADDGREVAIGRKGGQVTGALEDLRRYLRGTPAGLIPIQDRVQLLGFLESAWSELEGGSLWAMEGRKLNRIKEPSWNPPVLSFKIERHGAIVVGGSSYAELQTWTVDVEEATADAQVSGHRQVRLAAPRLDVKPIVAKVVSLADAGADDPFLKWSADRTRVTVMIGRVIPATRPRQTFEGRRKRFRAALREAMEGSGWNEVAGTSPNTYERVER
jgi:hypothetical protein